jgi:hypothetical protein
MPRLAAGILIGSALAVLCLASPAFAATAFQPAVAYDAGSQPFGVVTDDLRGNGNLDLVVADDGPPSGSSVLLGNGAGAFASPSTLSNPMGLNQNADVATGDFNNDGEDDVVSVGNGGAAVYLGNGAGGFGPGMLFGAGNPNSVSVGFFNADSNLDIAVGQASGSSANVLFGDGAGSFSAGPTLPVGTGSTHVATDDFNDDGHDDVAAASSASNQLFIFLGDGAGGFTAPAGPFATGDTPADLATGDIDVDGNEDVVTSNYFGDNVSVLLGMGNGAMHPRHDFPAATSPASVVIDDFDSDGHPDLAVSQNLTSSAVTLLLGDGAGSFAGDGSFPTGHDNGGVTSGDFNNDGNPDVAVSATSDNKVDVLLAQPPTVSVSPTSLSFGNQNVGTTSGEQTVTLTNNGPQTIGPVASITGPQAGDYQRVNDHCSASSIFVGPGGTCTLGVRFKPGSTGGKAATLEISSNAAGSPQKVPLSGTGVEPSSPTTTTSTTPVVPIFDRTPPTQSIAFPRQTVRSVLRDGLIMFASCSEPCAFRADVFVKSPTKKHRRRRGRAARLVTAGAANAELGTTRRRVVVRIRKSARGALKRTRKLTLITTATDTVGNASRLRRGLKLRRR